MGKLIRNQNFTKLIALIAIILIATLRADIAFLSIYILLIPYLLITKHRQLLYSFGIASIMSLVWMFLAHNMYGYNHDYLVLGNLNIFPLFGWPIGLLTMQMIFLKLKKHIKTKGLIKDFLLFAIPYFILLIIGETVFYHWLDVHDMVTAGYPGLPICDCIHAPHWMQAVYFGMGPVFFLVNRVIAKE